MLSLLPVAVFAATGCAPAPAIPSEVYQPLVLAGVGVLNALAIFILAQVRRNGNGK